MWRAQGTCDCGDLHRVPAEAVLRAHTGASETHERTNQGSAEAAHMRETTEGSVSKHEYVIPDAKMLTLAKAMSSPPGTSFGETVLKEAPAGTYTVDIQVRYIARDGKRIGDVMGFEL